LSQQKEIDVTTLPIKVSVVITNYNQGQYCEFAINSILSQTYKNIDITIVDDCSTDNSVEQITKYVESLQDSQKSRICLLVHDKNRGTASARNTGIKNSNGELISFLDIDDFYYPDKISASVLKMIETPGVGVVYSDYNVLNQKTGIVYREFKAPFNFNKLVNYCMVSTNSLVKREVFNTIGLFDETIKGMEDYNLWLRTATRFMLVHLPFALFCYRSHGQNKTETTNMQDWMNEENKMKQSFLKSIGRI
jgi:glycosyltransferase involved in cell wall biosynthesis